MTATIVPRSAERPSRRQWIGWSIHLVLLGLTAVLAPIVAIAVILALVGGLVISRSERDPVTLLTVFLMMSFLIPSPLVVVPLGGSATPATLFGLVMLWYWAFTKIVPNLGMARGTQPVRIAAYVLAAAVIASYAAAYARPIEAFEMRAADRGTVVIASALGITLLAADGIRNRARLDTLLQRLVLLGAMLAGIGILQFATSFDVAGYLHPPGLGIINNQLQFIEVRANFPRVAGTTLHAIEFGVTLSMILPIAVHYAMYRAKEHANRWWPWTAVGMIAIAIPMALSRSAIIGVGVGFLVMFAAWNGRQRLRAIAAVVALLVVVSIAVPGLVGAIDNLFGGIKNDPSYSSRTQDYAQALPYITSAPVFGRGFKTFVPEDYFLIDNQYLSAIIEIGVVGLACMLTFLVIAASAARGARRRSRDPATRDLGQCLAASVLIALVTFATFDALGNPIVTGVTFLIVGCAGALWRLETAREDRHAEPAID